MSRLATHKLARQHTDLLFNFYILYHKNWLTPHNKWPILPLRHAEFTNYLLDHIQIGREVVEVESATA